MPFTELYEAAAKVAKSLEVRQLLQDLAKRSRKVNRLNKKFGEQIAANRSRREGKPFKFSKAAQEWMDEADEDADKAIAQAQRDAKHISEKQTLQITLQGWEMACEMHVPEYFHADDQEFARKIDRELRAGYWIIKQACIARGISAWSSPAKGGLSLNLAFARSITHVGTLGEDHTLLATHLKKLDEVACNAGQQPISDFIEHDPDRMAGDKLHWFSAAEVKPTFEALLAALQKPSFKIKDRRKVIAEVESVLAELNTAAKKRIKFHFVVLD
jgi:hypothetical protein